MGAIIYKRNYIGPDNDGSTLEREIGGSNNNNNNNKSPTPTLLLNNTLSSSPIITVVEYKAGEENIKTGDKLQLQSVDEPYKVIKLRHLKQDAYLFEFTDPSKIYEDSPFCIGVAMNDAVNINDNISVQLRQQQ